MKTNFYRIGLACLSTLIFSCSAEETTSSDNQELLDRIEELEAQINDTDDLQSYIDQIALLEREIEDLESSGETYDPDLLASLQAQIEELQTEVNANTELLSMFDAYNLDNHVVVNLKEYQDDDTGYSNSFTTFDQTYTFDKITTNGYSEGYKNPSYLEYDGDVYSITINNLSDNDYFNSIVDTEFDFVFNIYNDNTYLRSYYFEIYDYDNSRFNTFYYNTVYSNISDYEIVLNEFNIETNQVSFDLSITIIVTESVNSEELTFKRELSISFDNKIDQLVEN